MTTHPEKWRPTLAMVVFAMLAIVLCLPLGSLWMFRFFDNHLVLQTEAELIAQGAFIEAMMAGELRKQNFDPSGLADAPPKDQDANFFPVLPKLDLAGGEIKPQREDARPSEANTDSTLLEVGRALEPVILEAQRTTLAGFRLLDANGVVIMGRDEVGMTLGHVPEISQALKGEYASVIRQRVSKSPTPPIYSISRGTNIRVFVAMPIAYQGKIAGVVYLSRTPSHFLRELYSQRWKVIGAALLLIAITGAIAFIFVRLVKGPIEALNARSKAISAGDRSAFKPLSRHGTREVASLSKNLLSMAEKLQARSDYIGNFATHVSHELKSPLTSMRGAAEILLDGGDAVKTTEREKFLRNILQDTERLTNLLDRLRALARAESLTIEGTTRIAEILPELKSRFTELEITGRGELEVELPVSREAALMVFSNLVENSFRHEAKRVELTCTPVGKDISILISDDGSGVSDANRDKIFELFFTTRREKGGTGMGLGIVQSILQSHGGGISLAESEKGASFEVRLPAISN